MVEIVNESPAPFVVALVVRGASAVDLADATVVRRRSERAAHGPPAVALGDERRRHDRGPRDERAGVRRAVRGAARPGGTTRRRVPLPGRAPHDAARGSSRWARAASARSTRGALPDAAAVARGWTAQLDRGMRVELPDESLARAVQTARAATRAGGPGVEGRSDGRRGARGLGPRSRGGGGVGPADRARATPDRSAHPTGRRVVGRGAVARVAARMPRCSTRCDRWSCATPTTASRCSPSGRPNGSGSRSTCATRRPDGVRCRTRSGGTAIDPRCCGRRPRARASPRPDSTRAGSTDEARGEALLAAPEPRR